jgi:hypothetical protein
VEVAGAGVRWHHRLTAPDVLAPGRAVVSIVLEAPVMSAVPPTAGPAGVQSAAVAAPASGRLCAGEAAVLITVIAAVTVLAVLERPIPAVLSLLTAAAGLLLAGGRAGRLLAAIAVGSRG